MTMNSHQIRHLPAEAMKFGPIDTFGCWKFENICKRLAELHCSTKNPLVGLTNRLKVRSSFEKDVTACWPPKLSRTVGRRHYRIQWKITLSSATRDRHFMHRDGTVCMFEYAIEEDDTVFLIARRFIEQKDHFVLGSHNVSFRSSKYGIWRLSKLSEFTLKLNIGAVANKVVVHKKRHNLIGYKLLDV